MIRKFSKVRWVVQKGANGAPDDQLEGRVISDVDGANGVLVAIGSGRIPGHDVVYIDINELIEEN